MQLLLCPQRVLRGYSGFGSLKLFRCSLRRGLKHINTEDYGVEIKEAEGQNSDTRNRKPSFNTKPVLIIRFPYTVFSTAKSQHNQGTVVLDWSPLHEHICHKSKWK